MDRHWIKLSSSLNKGISEINKLDETRFEQFLKRIVAKLKLQDTEVFTNEEVIKLESIFNIEKQNISLVIKTLQYIFKRLLKYIFMPKDLKEDLRIIGLNNDKSDIIVKVWSVETRTKLNEIGGLVNDQPESLNFSWKLSAELSSDLHKKCKIPKAYLSFVKAAETTEVELSHPELYSIFLQFESIQNELDNLVM